MTDPTTPAGSIAIVGMAGRFPAARDIRELWRLLADGREATTWLSDDELLAAGARPEDLALPNYVKAAMVLPDMEMFDAGFFGFSPREAAILDPQHRHFLECCWEALEDAGHVPRTFGGAIGVFGGCGMQAYMAEHLLPNRKLREAVGLFLLRHTGNDKDFLTTRVSYLLDLKGPSIGVQTACSTSLVAVHVACQSLLAGECDMALAGGVSIELPHRHGYIAAEGEILSPTGHCAAFDDDAKGTIFGSGAAVVVLRRLEDALADGDSIRAVILGTAVNNDGAGKAGYLAPSVDGQARAAAEAVAIAGVPGSTIDYIEAHGTGTVIGDPIELAALAQIYGAGTAPGTIGIGSVKSNIGHLDTAAGAAALIKVVLGMERGVIPASLNFKRPNSRFDFAASPFAVVSSTRSWPQGVHPRRAAINSLGVGGTNAHAVIEEAPASARATRDPGPADDHVLITLSARTPAALDGLVAKWRAFLAEDDRPLSLADAAFTTQVGREAFPHRLAIAAQSKAGLAESLAGRGPRRSARGLEQPDPGVVMMFPGGGAQYPAAARGLYRAMPAFRAAADACLAAMPPEAAPLAGLLFGAEADAADASARLEHPLLSILAVFTVSYALARTWESLGVKPAAVIGHSAGDYAAAVVAGVMSLEDAIGVVAVRGEIFADLPPGAMLSVHLEEEELRRRAGAGLDVAVLNGPGLGVVSGSGAAIEALKTELDAAGIDNARVRIGVAAHSRMLEPFLDRLRARLAAVRLSPPRLPMISGLSGGWADPDEVATVEYWVRHLRQTVRFGEGLATVLETPGRILLEVGSGQGLSAMARLAEARERPAAIVSSTRSALEADDDLGVLATAAGALWANGAAVDLGQLRGAGPHRRVSLPTYAFERQRHWIDAPVRSAGETPATDALTSVAVRQQEPVAVARLARRSDWFQMPTMRPMSLGRATPSKPGAWLVLADGSRLASETASELQRRGCKTFVVEATDRAALGSNDARWTIDPSRSEDHEALIAALDARKARIEGILHFWSLPAGDGMAAFEGLFRLLKASTLAGWDDLSRLLVVTSGVAGVDGARPSRPDNATLLGPVRVWPRETPGASAAVVDIAPGEADAGRLAGPIVDEALAAAPDTLVALRGTQRFVETIVPADASGGPTSRIRNGGVYLVTGGLGGIGRLIGQHLVAEHDARLVLVGRRGAAGLDQTARAWLARLGDKALVLAADVTDEAAMARAIEAGRARFGRIDGVVHAAGAMRDAPLATKTLEDVKAVMAPKVLGGAVLDKLLPPGSLDLFAVISSTSALAGPPGQIDYTAANAYLDALALSRPDGLSIAWGIWRDAGLATRVSRAEARGLDGEPTGDLHPLLGRRAESEGQSARFVAHYNAAALWVLAEHAVGGVPVLPGLAYIEIARAALAATAPGRSLALADAELRAPLAVPFATRPRIVTEITGLGSEAATLTVSSSADDDGEPILHFRARIVETDRVAAPFPPWDGGTRVAADRLVAQAGAVDFGPRWQSIRSVEVAEGRVRATLVLPEDLRADLAVMPVHPGLADMATTVGLHLLADEERARSLYVPARIGRVVVHSPLAPRLLAEARLVSAEPGRRIVLDATVADEAGTPLMTLERFELEAIPRRGFALPEGTSNAGGIVGRLLAAGIRAAEAPELLKSALATEAHHLVVSSIALGTLDRLYRESLAPARRPDRDAVPVAAADGMTATEQVVAGLFADLLGLDRVGPDDEFLALGGHSLAAVRLFAAIRRQTGVDLGMATLFEAPSVRALAALIDESRGEAPPPSRSQASGDKAAPPARAERSVDTPRRGESAGPGTARRWRPLVRIAKGEAGRPALYWIHGAMGNVVSIKPLSDQIGRRYPVYGLQAQGIDGRLPPLEKVEDMAMSYVAAIREVDPEGPYCLLGYSGGGVIGYEMARQLDALGLRVPLLAMIDTLAPTHAHRASLADWLRFAYREGVDRFAEQVRLGWQQTIEQLTRRLRPDAPVGEAVDQLVVNSERVFDAYVRAQSHYYVRPYDGDILLFRALRGGIPFQMAGPTLGWEEHVGDRIEVHEIDGNHATIIEPPSVDEIAGRIEERLERLWREQQGLGAGADAPAAASPTLIAAK